MPPLTANMLDLTDKELTSLIVSGDNAAFRLLYDRYRDPIYGYALALTRSKEIAADIVQDVFLKVWMNRGALNPELSIKSFLFRCVKNQVLDQLKRAVHDEKFRRHLLNSSPEGIDSTGQIIFSRELERIQTAAISRLPGQRRLIFKMSRVEGMSHGEIADELGISPHTVKDQLVKATRFVRLYLKQHGEIASLMVYLTQL